MQIFYINLHKKTFYKKTFLTIFIWSIILLILFYSKTCFEITKVSLDLFIYNVFPAIFPFILLTEFLIQSNLIHYLSVGIDNVVCKMFKLSNNSIPVILIGNLFGYPNSIKYATHLFENGQISKSDYTKLLSFTNNPSIIYILSSIGLSMFHSIKIGVLFFASSILSSIVIGVCYNPLINTSIIQQTEILSNTFYKKKRGYFQVLASSIQKTFSNMSFIVAFMIIFAIIPNIACNIFHIPDNISKILLGIFEITGGCNNLAISNLNLQLKVILTAFILNFSSVMIIFELYNECCKYISFKKLFLFKLLQGILGSIITYIAVQFININELVPVFKNMKKSMRRALLQ